MNKDSTKSAVFRLKKEEVIEIEIDGKKTRNWEDYIKIIGDELDFPESDRYPGFNGYLDWMEDLDWLPKSIVIIIKIINYEEFLSKNLEVKNTFLELANEIVEEWNETEINPYYTDKTIIFYLID